MRREGREVFLEKTRSVEEVDDLVKAAGSA